MSAVERFEQLLALVTRVLKAKGFSKHGPTFFRKEDGNWQIVNFQRSRMSTSAKVDFAVNFGVASTRLLQFFARARDLTRPPRVSDWHWRRRLGASPAGGDKWWSVRSNTDSEKVAEDILIHLNEEALPELVRLGRDEGLRDLWLEGQSPALTELQRLQNLAVLLDRLGPTQALPAVIEDLRRLSRGAAETIEERLESGTGRISADRSELIGVWISDSHDTEGIHEFGRASLDFQPDGQLTYTTHLPDRDQKIFLTFRVEQGVLVTNQPSAPREERTVYSFTPDGKLVLWFGGQRSVYARRRE